ncbi:MAG: hypothetical protein ACTSQJ_18080 [Promethearchaeota archaeon]
MGFKASLKKKSIKIVFFLFIFHQLIFLTIFRGLGSNNTVYIVANDELKIDFFIEGPAELEEDKLNIIEVEVKYNGTIVPEDEMEIHKYHVYKDLEGNNRVFSGDLKWNEDDEVWEKKGINLAGTGIGKFYVTVEFQTEDMKKSIETEISEDPKYSYSRVNLIEVLIQISWILGLIFGVAFTIIVLYIKKSKGSIERKVKEPKGDIKVKELTKEELKKAKKEKKKEQKEKGKTQVGEDLIFSVPKWETDEDE